MSRKTERYPTAPTIPARLHDTGAQSQSMEITMKPVLILNAVALVAFLVFAALFMRDDPELAGVFVLLYVFVVAAVAYGGRNRQ